MFTIAPTSFGVIPSRQNPYLDPDVDWELAQRQHANLRRALGNPPAFAVPRDAPSTSSSPPIPASTCPASRTLRTSSRS